MAVDECERRLMVKHGFVPVHICILKSAIRALDGHYAQENLIGTLNRYDRDNELHEPGEFGPKPKPKRRGFFRR